MLQRYGLNNTVGIDQLYIELDRQNDYIAYSYPIVLRDGTNLAYRIKQDPPYLSTTFQKVKDKNQTYLDYAGYDIAKHGKRTVSQTHPLRPGGKPAGVIVWESDLDTVFKQTLIPKSYLTKKYPFI